MYIAAGSLIRPISDTILVDRMAYRGSVNKFKLYGQYSGFDGTGVRCTLGSWHMSVMQRALGGWNRPKLILNPSRVQAGWQQLRSYRSLSLSLYRLKFSVSLLFWRYTLTPFSFYHKRVFAVLCPLYSTFSFESFDRCSLEECMVQQYWTEL